MVSTGQNEVVITVRTEDSPPFVSSGMTNQPENRVQPLYYMIQRLLQTSSDYFIRFCYTRFMVHTYKDKVVITIQSEDPIKTLKELRFAITSVTTVLIGSDEWNFHPELPEAVSALIRLQGELVKED